MSEAREEASELRRAAEEHRDGSRTRYPEEIRKRVETYAVARLREGMKVSRIAREVGLAEMTVQSWLKNPRRERVREPWARVTMVAEEKSERGRYILRNMKGWRVEGLSLEEIAQLMNAVGE